MFKHLKTRLRAFRREEEGSIVAEVVTMAPTLVAAILATYVFFDALRNQSVSLMANYTIADAVSRESDYIDETYIGNFWNLHKFPTNSRLTARVRVSVIKYDSESKTHTVV
jgi:hypothetical protein